MDQRELIWGDNAIGRWFIYDIALGYDYPDVVYITDLMNGHYVMKLWMDQKTFNGIMIDRKEFETHALPLTEQEAMIEILKR